MTKLSQPKSMLPAVASVLFATGAASAPLTAHAQAQLTEPLAAPAALAPSERLVSDPLERLNRSLYSAHRVLDTVIVRPLMLVYRAVSPPPLRSGLSNVAGNLGEPITFANDVLQARPRKASRTLARFATNSSLGVGGLFDVAKAAGHARHYSDFGQTLGRWGVGPGPFLFVPILGPSSLRDIAGRVVDSAADPVTMVRWEGRAAVRIARPVVSGLELRAQYDRDITELEKTATDPYVTLRSAYLQNRQSVVMDGQVDVDALPSFTPEPQPATSPGRSPAPTAGPAVVEPARNLGVALARPSFFRNPQ